MIRPSDERQLADRGVSLDEARRQLELLAGPHYLELVRPCTVGDGIRRLGEEEILELHALHAEAARAGRFVKFVPSSGAASRMFDALHANVESFLEQLHRFPFYEELRDRVERDGQDLERLAASGKSRTILEALLGSEGLDYARRPKGLMKFHRYPDGDRTAFEEHLVEAGEYTRDSDGLCRVHFTVSHGHRTMFDETQRRVEPRYRRQGEPRFEIRYSTQNPSLDTLSLDHAGRPLRDQAGHLKFRPGGHGVLIDNLNELQADLVFIKNIDNVQPDRIKPLMSHWKRALAGYLVRIQREVFRQLDALHGPEASAALVAEAREFVRKRLHQSGDRLQSVPDLIERLHRPLRVCGVVPDTGEPGGGPFWVRERDGSVSLQIVEASQVDAHDEQQLGRLKSSTHFNPVDLVCGVRDHAGRPFDLLPFVDPEAVNVTCKSGGAGQTKVLERPGLWNGAMARWNTLFVEVPIETFSPVKTVLDLLRDEHQPAGGAG